MTTYSVSKMAETKVAIILSSPIRCGESFITHVENTAPCQIKLHATVIAWALSILAK